MKNEHVQRAIAALQTASNGHITATKAKAFTEIALALGLSHRQQTPTTPILKRSTNVEVLRFIERAAPTVTVGDFDGIEGQAIQAAYAASLAPGSILDACLNYAKVIPPNIGKVLAASGFTGNATAEGDPRVIADPSLSVSDCTDYSVFAPVIFTEETLNRGGAAAQALFENELRLAIMRALNSEMRTALQASADETVTATADPVADLRSALAKADPADGYVFVAPGNTIAAMATDPANRGAGVRGGEFVPGIWLCADDDIDDPILIPAGRLVVRDEGLKLQPPARHASVNLSASPTSPSQMVNLWQTGAIGLMASRTWRMNNDDVNVVKVV